jgi:Ribonuclease G/E
VNVSRQIKDPGERERLAAAVAAKIEQSECFANGFIVRTAAAGVEAAEIGREIRWLIADANLAERATSSTPPLNRVANRTVWSATQSLSEWAFPLPVSVVATPKCLGFLRSKDDLLGPVNLWGSERLLECLTEFTGPDLFDHYGIWDEIERLKSPRVDLPSGAWMAVEATRAMITVDVNTAGEFGGGAPLTANLEAARELPRQLRLRGLGGQITIDFAPLKKSGRKRIEDALKTSFRRDPVETTLAGWTPLGNFELQRKRERRPLTELVARTGSPTI